MGDVRPELIFLAGPQQGQRAVLMKNKMIVGRAPNCDIVLAEEFVSRQQVRFEQTPDGWIVENLSSSGTRINGKKYKAGKRILLETGDVLAVGSATEILFVAPGDNPELALEQVSKVRAAAAAAAPPAPAEPAPRPVPEAFAPEAVREAPPAAAAETDEDVKARLKRKKTQKYALYGGIYAAILVMLALVFSSLRPQLGSDHNKPIRLSDEDIAEAINQKIKRDYNSAKSAEYLGRAEAGYDTRMLRPRDLHDCVKWYKLHLAYENRPEFETHVLAERYTAVKKELIERIQGKYREGWMREEEHRWPDAVAVWQKLAKDVPPDGEWDTDGHKKLVDNIMSHQAYAQGQIPKKKGPGM